MSQEELNDSPIQRACEPGNFHQVKQFLDNITTDAEKSIQWMEYMSHACKNGNLPLVKYLAEEKNVKIEQVDADCETLEFSGLAVACASGCLPIVKYLAEERGAITDLGNTIDETPLMFACIGGHLDVVKYLIERHSVDIHVEEEYGRTGLDHAGEKGHLPVVKYFFEGNDALVLNDIMKFSCLFYASEAGHLQIVKYLIEEAGMETKGCLLRACDVRKCSQRHLSVIKYLVEEVDTNIHETNFLGNNCLMLACRTGFLPIIRYLIEERHMSTDFRNDDGDTFLMCVDNVAVARYLVEDCSVDIEEKNNRGENALMMACNGNHFLIVQYLIEERQANLEAVDADGKNCLFFACRGGSIKMVEYLIIDQWMEPPALSSLEYVAQKSVREYLGKCTTEYLSQKRREFWTRRHQTVNRFIQESMLKDEWKSHQESTFIQGVPLYVTNSQALLERNPGPPADLKLCFIAPSESSQSLERIVVFIKKKQLSKSCSFMHNLVSGEMNDVQDDPEHDRMQMVELSQDLTQDCPAEWLKQLLAFLSWSRGGDRLHHSVKLEVPSTAVSFHEIEKALKYCRMCHTLGIDVDVSAWTKFIKEYVEKYNHQWIESTIHNVQIDDIGNGYCIRNVKRFDQERFDLWTRVLGESDEVYFFMLVNAAPATAETRSTIASQCREWLVSFKSTQTYKKILEYPLFVAVLYMHTDFKFSTGTLSAPVETEEEFVQRKRRRIE